jgi:hypothetical protein
LTYDKYPLLGVAPNLMRGEKNTQVYVKEWVGSAAGIPVSLRRAILKKKIKKNNDRNHTNFSVRRSRINREMINGWGKGKRKK